MFKYVITIQESCSRFHGNVLKPLWFGKQIRAQCQTHIYTQACQRVNRVKWLSG